MKRESRTKAQELLAEIDAWPRHKIPLKRLREKVRKVEDVE